MANLSTMRGLSRQRRASSGRYSRLEQQRSPYTGLGTFAMAPVQNELSGGPPLQEEEAPVTVPSVGRAVPSRGEGTELQYPEITYGKDDPVQEKVLAASRRGAKSGFSLAAPSLAKTGIKTAAGMPLKSAVGTTLASTLNIPSLLFKAADVGAPFVSSTISGEKRIKRELADLGITDPGEIEVLMNAAEAQQLYPDMPTEDFGAEQFSPLEQQISGELGETTKGARPYSTQLKSAGLEWLKKKRKGGGKGAGEHTPYGSLEQDVMESGRGIGWSGETTGDYSIDSMQDIGPLGGEDKGGGDWDFDFDW